MAAGMRSLMEVLCESLGQEEMVLLFSSLIKCRLPVYHVKRMDRVRTMCNGQEYTFTSEPDGVYNINETIILGYAMCALDLIGAWRRVVHCTGFLPLYEMRAESDGKSGNNR